MAVASRAEFNQLISDRLATDPSFADALTANPHAAIAELVGSEIPAGLVIDVHRESLAHLHIVIPVMNATSELGDDDLELVSGGVTTLDQGFGFIVGCDAAYIAHLTPPA